MHNCTIVALLCALVSSGHSQEITGTSADDDAIGEAAAPVPNSPAWTVAGFQITGVADGFLSLNLNDVSEHVNALRNFDDRAGRFEINMASVSVDRSPRPLGVHLDAGAGRAFDIMGASEKGATGMRFFEQAFIDLKPLSWKGIQLDLGKFSSWAGAEAIETPKNWNYSRSLLFVWCTPAYNFGVRANIPSHKRVSTGAQLVTGWNNITGAKLRTVGLTMAWAPSNSTTWTSTYYGGPDENDADRGTRNLYDSVVQVSRGRVVYYVNLDYVHERPRYAPPWQVYGLAAAVDCRLSRRFSFAPRAEWMNDVAGMATGLRQQIAEVTATTRWALHDGLTAWVEFRDDRSNQQFFREGSAAVLARSQPTLLIGLVAVFRPRE